MQDLNKKSKAKAIFDGAAVLAVATVITKVLGLLYKVPLSRILHDEGMGYFNSAYTVYTFLYIICSAGVPKAVAIVLCEDGAKHSSRSREEKTVRSALALFLALGIAATLLFIVFSEKIAALIGNLDAAPTMLAVAPSVLFTSLAGVAKGHLTAKSRLLPLAVSQLIEGGAKFFLGVLFAVIGQGRGMPLPTLSAFTILGITLGSAASAIYLLVRSHRTLPPKTEEQAEGKSRALGRILRLSIPLTLGAAVMSISNMIDLAMIMKRLTAQGYTAKEASALYGNYTTLAVPMFNLVTALISPFFIAALPLLTRANARGNSLDFSDKVSLTLKKALFIATPSVFAFVFYSKEILSLIFTEEAANVGAPLLSMLAPSLIFLCGQTLINTALEAKGHVTAPIISMLVGSVPKILISYFLISDSAFGISAAPIGTLASYATGFLVSALTLYARTDVTVPLFRGFMPSALAAISALFVSETLKNLLTIPEGFIGRLVLLSIFGIIYLIFSIIISFLCRKTRKHSSFCTKKLQQIRQ